MITLKSLSSLIGLFRRRSTNESALVLGRDEFRRLLERERLRSDRNGETFSLITMTPPHRRYTDSLLPELIRALHSRLRATDDVGYLERGQLGVLLPATPSTGAWTVVDDVIELLVNDVDSPICEVYTYPSFDAFSGDEQEIEDRPDSQELEGSVGGDSRSSGRMESLFAISPPAWKRAADILGAAFGLVLMFPVLVLISAIVKLTSPGPVLFRQLRRGQGGQAFFVYKFRSMVDGAEVMQRGLLKQNEQDGPAFKIKTDPRITPFGKFLRCTGLDEFPQLWNVLKGDMSLVGPRPLPCHESDASASWQQRRLDMRPGLTCIWQSRGHEHVSFDDWMRMDMQYMTEQRPSLDLHLIAKTALMVLRGKASG
jgi:lipopolysaccharide/colanic/teichoic acid biosynthesis glycosyltransferase